VVTSLKVGGGQQTDSGSHERQGPGVDGEAGSIARWIQIRDNGTHDGQQQIGHGIG
jgi:hypothetical protein